MSLRTCLTRVWATRPFWMRSLWVRTCWPRLCEKIAAWLSRPASTRLVIGTSSLSFNPQYLIYVRAYYLYSAQLFAEALSQIDATLHLDFDTKLPNQGYSTRSIQIGFQFEHCLVKPGGRDTQLAVSSSTPLPNGDGFYLARIEGLEHLRKCDWIIEYSAPNFQHLADSAHFEFLLKKTSLISPLVYPVNFHVAKRRNHCITSFSNPEEGRRAKLLEHIKRLGVEVDNVKGIYDPDYLRRIYLDSEIMLNVHQTDHHDTLEELRILPALLCGMVVVSEDVPLRQRVPYAEFVIWAAWDEIPQTLLEVSSNISSHRQRLFGNPRLRDILADMAKDNRANVLAAVQAMGNRVP